MKQSADGIRQQTIARIIQYNTIPYGTILVKIESQSSHVSRGDIVHYGKWALGTIKNVSGSMALVELYSNTNKTYDVRMNESIGTYTGLSNGTGRVYLPHTSKIVLNTPVSLVQSDKMIIGTIYDKQSQNQNAIKTLLVSLPFNMRDISFVMISK
jgi:cell shape-determining protein MreC